MKLNPLPDVSRTAARRGPAGNPRRFADSTSWALEYRAPESDVWINAGEPAIAAAGLLRVEGADAGDFRLKGSAAGATIRVLPAMAAAGPVELVDEPETVSRRESDSEPHPGPY